MCYPNWLVHSLFMYWFALPLNIVYGLTANSSRILKCCLLVSDTDHSAKVF